MRLERAVYPAEVHFDDKAWAWSWRCIVPGCHEGGTDFASRDEAQAVGQAHADVHTVRSSW